MSAKASDQACDTGRRRHTSRRVESTTFVLSMLLPYTYLRQTVRLIASGDIY